MPLDGPCVSFTYSNTLNWKQVIKLQVAVCNAFRGNNIKPERCSNALCPGTVFNALFFGNFLKFFLEGQIISENFTSLQGNNLVFIYRFYQVYLSGMQYMFEYFSYCRYS